MGAYIGNDYVVVVPTWTLDGSTKIFQTAIMVKANGAAAPELINNAVRTILVSAGRPCNAANMFVGFTLASVHTYYMKDGVMTYAIDETPVIGTLAGSLGTPINTSLLLKKNTGLVGKRYRGRFMIPNLSIAEANISQAGIIASASRVAYETIWQNAIGDINAGLYDTVLGHTSSEVLPTPYSTVTLQPKIGTMSRRIRGF